MLAVANAEDRARAHRGAEPSDHLTFEEDDPVTRYAPIVQLGGGLAAGTQELTATETMTSAGAYCRRAVRLTCRRSCPCLGRRSR